MVAESPAAFAVEFTKHTLNLLAKKEATFEDDQIDYNPENRLAGSLGCSPPSRRHDYDPENRLRLPAS